MKATVDSVFMFLFVLCFECSGFSVKTEKSLKKVKLNRYLDEKKPEYWMSDGASTLRSKLEYNLNRNIAKNVILFMGDGMSFSTLAATRVYMGRQQGLMGEEVRLSFEEFPYTGLSKTYCLDRQVADSACSATAYLCGVKTNYGTVGLSGSAKRGDCVSQMDPANRVDSVAAWAQRAGKKTGVVTTTRVTHASPAGVYAHAAERNWESDTDMHVKEGGCVDIATQLVTGPVGEKLNVIMGGGRKNFYSKDQIDPEGTPGYRSDGKDLIAKWKHAKGNKGTYVHDRSSLFNDTSKYDYLLGLFEPDHMKYYLDSDPTKDPTLAEMTERAIQFLDRENNNGYFLFVEGGRIDMAHHETKARKALDETVQFSLAVEAAMRLVDLNETLVVVTADHSHSMTYNGYNRRGGDILGLSQLKGSDGFPYTTLSYSNGPGYKESKYNKRYNLEMDDLNSKNYMFPSMVPLLSETHAGEDVAVFAAGAWSHLFTGAWEQTYIPHAIAFAACLTDSHNACDAQH